MKERIWQSKIVQNIEVAIYGPSEAQQRPGLQGALLEYCSAVWCSAVDTHLKLLHMARVVSGWCQFFHWGYVHIAHRRSVVVLCTLYNIRCNLMHPLFGALTGLYVAVQVKRGALVLAASSLQNLAGPINLE